MNEVAKKMDSSVVTQTRQAPTQEILSTDILIPRLLLMQGLSDLVADRKAVAGDFVRSTTEKKMGDDKTPIDFIPLKATMEWIEQEKIGQKFEFRKTVPRNSVNENYPWSFYRNPQGAEFDRPGAALGLTEWRRVKVINVYALLPRDVDAFQAEMEKCHLSGEMPDLTTTVLPIVIPFRSTSFNAGKTVTTFFAQVDEMRQFNSTVKHFAYSMPLSCYGDKNDKGSYFVLKVGSPAKVDAKYIPLAERWYNTLSSRSDIQVDVKGESETVAEGGQF